jgi:hypothetical protein
VVWSGTMPPRWRVVAPAALAVVATALMMRAAPQLQAKPCDVDAVRPPDSASWLRVVPSPPLQQSEASRVRRDFDAKDGAAVTVSGRSGAQAGAARPCERLPSFGPSLCDIALGATSWDDGAELPSVRCVEPPPVMMTPPSGAGFPVANHPMFRGMMPGFMPHGGFGPRVAWSPVQAPQPQPARGPAPFVHAGAWQTTAVDALQGSVTSDGIVLPCTKVWLLHVRSTYGATCLLRRAVPATEANASTPSPVCEVDPAPLVQAWRSGAVDGDGFKRAPPSLVKLLVPTVTLDHRVHTSAGVITIPSRVKEITLFRVADALLVADSVISSNIIIRLPSFSSLISELERRPLPTVLHVRRCVMLTEKYTGIPQHFAIDALPKLNVLMELMRRYDDLHILYGGGTSGLHSVRGSCTWGAFPARFLLDARSVLVCICVAPVCDAVVPYPSRGRVHAGAVSVGQPVALHSRA